MHAPTDAEFAMILANVSKHITLSQEEQDLWRSMLRSHTVHKGACLLEMGEVSRYQNFVTQGCLRSYHINEDGKEHILQFAPEDWWTGDMASFQKNTPALLAIDALEEARVLQLDKPSQDLLYERVPKFERFFRILITNAFVAQQRRMLSNLSRTAEERYAEFRSLYPSLDGRVAQKHIASYLGMTPEFLSTVRKRVLAKE